MVAKESLRNKIYINELREKNEKFKHISNYYFDGMKPNFL